MQDYLVKAKRYNETVEFYIQKAVNAKDALIAARAEAATIFDYVPGQGDAPMVAIKPVDLEKE